MKKTEKINRSRNTLKEILSNEWDTSVIADYSDSEIEKIYFNADNPYQQFSNGFNCNIILNNLKIPSYRLLILYVNFKENDKKSQKLNDTIREKIKLLYQQEYINFCDSILLIIDENISESINNYINTLNIELFTELNPESLTNDIKEDLKKNNITLGEDISLRHFKNVHCIDINSLTNNLLKHSLMPAHNIIRDKKSINDILEKCNCNLNQLPIILKNDIMAKLNRMTVGDIIEITRKSIKCGDSLFYRVCK